MTEAYTLHIPAPADWINTNDRTHWAVRARLTKTWRAAAYLHACKLGLPKDLGRVHVMATITKPTRRRFDVANLYPSVKAAIDGAVDYGVVEDDSNGFLVGPDMRANPEPGPAALTLTITVTPMQDGTGSPAAS